MELRLVNSSLKNCSSMKNDKSFILCDLLSSSELKSYFQIA
jgi:hypothetical protein